MLQLAVGSFLSLSQTARKTPPSLQRLDPPVPVVPVDGQARVTTICSFRVLPVNLILE